MTGPPFSPLGRSEESIPSGEQTTGDDHRGKLTSRTLALRGNYIIFEFSWLDNGALDAGAPSTLSWIGNNCDADYRTGRAPARHARATPPASGPGDRPRALRLPQRASPHLKTFVNEPERTMGVTVDRDVLYPDIVVLQWPEKMTQMVAQVESTNTVTEQQALDEWLPYSLAGPLYLFVPVGYAQAAKRICRRYRIAWWACARGGTWWAPATWRSPTSRRPPRAGGVPARLPGSAPGTGRSAALTAAAARPSTGSG